ncbi:exodeoxyribonuclease VII large subunit [uncultured Desulfovibrio sp.]|uniref:exodeoxyribonuclease VII large subunit n=1 Tax=uncultured Desulfovibrio sp. TaxID=167968 RepID=UPI00260C9960|nr:exodeoxyribonuclease VII large subunit [uncultured Desulfovibrio sp.]
MTEDMSIQSVSQLTDQLRRMVERHFPFVWVRGEVGDLSRPASGHLYFTLKDAGAQLRCVWFRQQQRQRGAFDPLTGEVFATPPPAPEELVCEGTELICAGHVGIYAPRGQYQLVVELAQAAGRGGLAQAFEERKRRLAALGYFAQERKRRLPWNPARVALLTSPHGAAIHDFWRLAAGRGQAAHIRLFPVPVQGEGAAPAIVRALAVANAQAAAPDGPQVIVLVRGGGSLEDLWAFNEQEVAEAIFHSHLPVLAGIGHEVDVTLADLTADVRAATPSHAAQLLWPSRQELLQRLDEAELSLGRVMRRNGERLALRLEHLMRILRVNTPQRQVERLETTRQRRAEDLRRALRNYLDDRDVRVKALAQALQAVWHPARLSLREAEHAAWDARLRAALPRFLVRQGQARTALARRLHAAGRQLVAGAEERQARLALRLTAHDPMGPLQRGYALVQAAGGELLHSVGQAHCGQDLSIRLQDGALGVTVCQIHPRPPEPAEGEGGS